MPQVDYTSLRWLNLLWVVAAVAAASVYGIWQRRRALRRFASAGLLARLAPPVSWSRRLLSTSLITAALLSLTVAAIGPRWGEQEQRVFRRGIDLLVLLDVSKSMLARDIAPNRLERAKVSIRDDLLPALGGDRIGLIAFAGASSVKCPLTTDYGFFRLALDDITTDSVPRGGTLIGDALRKAGKSFTDDADRYRIVLLITDGEDQESYPVQAAQELWEKKTPVAAIALGDEREGARVPVKQGESDEYLRYEGKTVWSKANFDDLRKITDLSDLKLFIPAGTRNFDLGEIYRKNILPRIQARNTEESQQVRRPLQAHWFALAGLICLVVESFLRPTPRRLMRQLRAPVREAA